MEIYINDETSRLRKVVLGIGDSFGGVPKLENTYDPKSKEFIKAGGFAIESDIVAEMDAFANVLEKYEVEVYRPKNIEDYNQIFSRDISFVIDDKFIKTNMIDDRAKAML